MATALDTETALMQRALELAKLGAGNVSPNPMVGCVIAIGNHIIGEGYHQQFGEAHAEVNAVNSVENKGLLQEATVYVTLEPCAHFGKTPPCADLLVEAGVKKVVIACTDPNPLVSGKGIEKLKAARIETNIGLLEQKALALNRRFFTRLNKSRPFIILKWAETADGFVAREDYSSKWISNPAARALVHKWRAEEDAVLVGGNTAYHDNPKLDVRNWKATKQPIRLVLTSNQEIPLKHDLFDGKLDTILLTNNKSLQYPNATILPFPKGSSMTSMMEALLEHNIQSILVEGGSSVLQQFISENCWDEARVFKSENSFEKGIPAPLLPARLTNRTTVAGNLLSYYLPINDQPLAFQ